MINAACRGVLRARRTLLLGALVAGGALVFVPSAFAAPTVVLSPATQNATLPGTPLGPGGAAAGSNASLSAVESGCATAAGNTVSFSVFAGPTIGVSGSSTTDGTGTATFSYSGLGSGQDSVRATLTCAGTKTGVPSNVAFVVWDNGINNYFPGISSSTSGSICGIGCVTGVPQGTSTTYTSAIDFCDTTDAGPPPTNSGAADYTVTWNFGDGTGNVAGTATVDGSCFDTAATHTYAHAGTYTVVETVTDTDSSGTNTVSGTEGTVTVTGITGTGIPFSTQEGTTFSGNTASFTTTNAGDTASQFTGTINWGDGSGTQAASVSGPNGGPFTVSGSHAYKEDGTYTVTSSLCQTVGGNPQCQSATSTATVTEATVTATGVGTISTPASFSGTVATFTDPNTLEGPASHYSASINWGAGEGSSTGTVSGSAGSFTVSGSHTFTTGPGAKTVTVQIIDDGVNNGAPVTSTFNVTAVTNPSVTANNFNATEGLNTGNFTVATFTDTDATLTSSNFSATITWGDASTSSGTVSGTAPNYTVTANHTYGEEGSYPVSVLVTDTRAGDGGANGTGNSTATVADAALSSSGIGTVKTNSKVFSGTVATFTDNDPAGALGDYTATINWGDGNTTAGTISGPVGGTFSVSGSHGYSPPGSHTVTVTIKDAGGSQTIATSTIGTGCSFGAC